MGYNVFKIITGWMALIIDWNNNLKNKTKIVK